MGIYGESISLVSEFKEENIDFNILESLISDDFISESLIIINEADRKSIIEFIKEKIDLFVEKIKKIIEKIKSKRNVKSKGMVLPYWHFYKENKNELIKLLSVDSIEEFKEYEEDFKDNFDTIENKYKEAIESDKLFSYIPCDYQLFIVIPELETIKSTFTKYKNYLYSLEGKSKESNEFDDEIRMFKYKVKVSQFIIKILQKAIDEIK